METQVQTLVAEVDKLRSMLAGFQKHMHDFANVVNTKCLRYELQIRLLENEVETLKS